MKAIFLDRDGVINVDKAYVSTKENFEFCKGVFEALLHFKALGYMLIIVTNQSGIGRGYYTQEDFDSLMKWVLSEFAQRGIAIEAVYHCPHAPEEGCTCRKPKSGMFEKALKAFDIDVTHSWMIGDKPSDLEAAMGVGITQGILIGTSKVKSILDTIELIQH